MAPRYSEEDDDRNYKRRDDDDDRQSSRRQGRQGFASMDPEEQREIASMGGRASHGGRGRNYESGYDDDRSYNTRPSSRYYNDEDDDYEERGRRNNRGRQGFASMDPEEQREIASMGGRASHGGRGRSYETDADDDNRRYSLRSSSRYDDENNDYEERSSSRQHGRQGFASMDPEERREIASMGGRASHGGRDRRSSTSGNRSHSQSGRSH